MRSFRIAAPAILALSLTACGGYGAMSPAAPAGAGMQNAGGPLSLSRSAVRVRAFARSQAGRAHGAGYPVTADPPVAHPAETPCVDVLFTPKTPPIIPGHLPVGEFADYSDHPFFYNPPANCTGPYAKIVLKVHFRVSAGVQYDRTGAIWVGATNIFFGTTAEPGSSASPEWVVQRDVTEYAPIFTQKSIGQASVYNIVNSQYTGIIYGKAELDFYPATTQYQSGKSADAVYPLSAGPRGGYVFLNGPSNQMTGTFTFPKNVVAAYLDLVTESQSGDEFWYTCFPNGLAKKLNNCGGTAFREAEVTVDSQPAGVAPVYPWIYSGGIDPFLWVPIPGVETLNFAPYRVNLTPFAGSFDDGNPHTIAVSVFNDNNYFAANGALLIYVDHHATQLTGKLVSDGTPASPAVKSDRDVTFGSSGAAGSIKTTATHPVSLYGYVDTSHGRVYTRVTQSITFSNLQRIDATSSTFLQNIKQLTTITSDTSTSGSRALKEHTRMQYPLDLHYYYQVGSGSTATQNTAVVLTKYGSGLNQRPDHATSWLLQNTVDSSDTLTFTPSGFTPSNGKSRQHYKSLNVDGACWDKTILSRLYTIVGSRMGC